MTRPRHPKTGKFVKNSTFLAKLASWFKGKPDEGKPTLIGHDPNAQERGTKRTMRK